MSIEKKENYWPVIGAGLLLMLFLFYQFFPFTSSTKPVFLSSFLDLNDTPLSYSGQAGKSVVVSLDENSLIFSDVNGSAFGDTNQVKVSSNDTTPGYLEDKLQAGSNITLTIQNEGGDENILISGSGGGGSGTTYTSGTPATIEVNNDTNTISQNFDGNFYSRFKPVFDGNFQVSFDTNYYPRNALLFPVPDTNLLDLSWTKLLNYPTGCGAFLAVQTIGDTLTCISVPSETNIDANALAVVNSLDLNNSLSYAKTDTNCDENTQCVLTGRLNSTFDANVSDLNANDANFNGNILLDGNLFAKDANTFIGAPSGSGNNDLFFTGYSYTANPVAGAGALIIPVNTGAFCVSTVCMPFSLTFRAIGINNGGVSNGSFNTFSDWEHMWFTGDSSSWYTEPKTTDPTYTFGDPVEGMYYTKDFQDPDDDNQLMQFSDGVWKQVGSHQSGDLNVNGDANLTSVSFGSGFDINYSNVDKNLVFTSYDLNDGFVFNTTTHSPLGTRLTFRMGEGGKLWAPNLPVITVGLVTLGARSDGLIAKASSSQQYKHDIVDLNIDTSKIHLLQPRQWTDNYTGETGYGFIAEEVQAILPEMVLMNENGEPESVDYRSIAFFSQVELLKEKEARLQLEQDYNQVLAVTGALQDFICQTNPLLQLCQLPLPNPNGLPAPG